MKIRVAFCFDDGVYADKITTYFTAHYSDSVDIYNFSEHQKLIDYTKNHVLDVLVVDEEINVKKLTGNAIVFRLVEGAEFGGSDGSSIALAKYQRANAIYRDILHFCSQRKDFSFRGSADKTIIYSFASIVGGAGASTVSAAFAIHLARQGRKVLYLNLDEFGDSGVYFDSDSRYTLDEVILALKTKNRNLAIKLQSAVSRTPEEVYFYPGCANAADMSQITAEEMENLLKAIAALDYRYVVIDFKMSLNERAKAIMAQSDHIVLVSDGTSISKTKFDRMTDALMRIDGVERSRLSDKLSIFNNRIENGHGLDISSEKVHNIGGVARLQLDGARNVAQYMAGMQSCFKDML